MLCNSRSLSFVWQKSCQYRQQLLQCQVRNLEWISLEKDPAKLNPRRMPYPEHDLPQPVTYNGPETLRVAYVMDRLPKLMDEEHPFEQEMQDLTEQNSKFYARTQWTSFFEYYKEWKKARTKQGVAAAADEKKGKKATHAKKSSIVHVPDPPELSEQERIELNRTFVRACRCWDNQILLGHWCHDACCRSVAQDVETTASLHRCRLWRQSLLPAKKIAATLIFDCQGCQNKQVEISWWCAQQSSHHAMGLCKNKL